MAQAVGTGRPAQRPLAGGGDAVAPALAAADVVVGLVVDPAIGDRQGGIEAHGFQPLGQGVG